jgi:phage gp36-like protein
MAYTTADQVRKEFGKLPPSVTDEMLNVYIEKASVYVDALLGAVYVVPMLNPPKLIQMIATDLAIYFFAESAFGSQNPNKMDESYQKRYDRSMKFIADILTGDLFIGVPPIDKDSSGFASTNDEEPIFTTTDPEW